MPSIGGARGRRRLAVRGDADSNPRGGFDDVMRWANTPPDNFGLLADRPLRGTYPGDTYYATNTTAWYVWAGSTWTTVSGEPQGLLAARPAGANGATYYATDTLQSFRHDGGGWIVMTEPTHATWAVPPILAQGGVGKTSTISRQTYSRANGWIKGTVQITCTQAGVAGSLITISAPVTGAYPNQECGNYIYVLASGTTYSGTLDLEVNVFYMWSTGGTTAIGGTPSFATANGDNIYLNYHYEMASRYS